jgi:glycerol-3-phosphate dehydrogenase subunit C
MPQLVEGDLPATLQHLRSNMNRLLDLSSAGYQLLGSCPTCSYMMRVLLKDRVYYSEAYQRSVNAGENEILIPDFAKGQSKLKTLHKGMFKNILRDDSCFSALDPLKRIQFADRMADIGEYLQLLASEGHLNTDFKAVSGRMAYFAPCHQRELKTGLPYKALLELIPGLTIEHVGNNDCCGMGGNFGFKKEFHEQSLAIGRPLLEKIERMAPDAIITDCMSCGLQFNQTLPYLVYHPLEILAAAYNGTKTG